MKTKKDLIGMDKMKKKILNSMFYGLLIIILIILINFSGRYMGMKELTKVQEGMVTTVLIASDICLLNNMTFFMNRKDNIHGCTPFIELREGMWYSSNIYGEKPMSINNVTSIK